LLDVKIDSKNKRIHLSFLPLGEQETIDIVIDGYTISDNFGEISFMANDVKVSREWLTVLASELVVGQKFQLPRGIAGKIANLIL